MLKRVNYSDVYDFIELVKKFLDENIKDISDKSLHEKSNDFKDEFIRSFFKTRYYL